MNNESPDGTCYICGFGNEDVIQEHHIVPRRYEGPDESRNLVDLCPRCHDAIERIYDDSFYQELGVELPNNDGKEAVQYECDHRDCTNQEADLLTNGDVSIAVCDAHQECNHRGCGRAVTPVEKDNGGIELYCEKHRVCRHRGCMNKDVIGYTSYGRVALFCEVHAEQSYFGVKAQ